MEFLEIRIDFERLFHNFESVFERDVERPPHLLGNISERAFTRVDLLIEGIPTGRSASVSVEEDVAGILHENGTIKVWLMLVRGSEGGGGEDETYLRSR